MADQGQDCAALRARVEALEAQLERHQTALDAISLGVAFFDSEEKLILANRRYAEIYRLSPDQLNLGMSLRDITELRGAAGTCPMSVDSYLTYVGAIAAKRENRDWSVTLSDGRTICVLYRPMANRGWVAIHEDVTVARERRMLVEEKVTLQSLIDVVPDNLWVKDADSRFVVANRPTALRMGHPSPDALIGKSDLELCPFETAQKYLADEREVIETGRPLIDFEEYILGADGAKTWIATTKAPLRNDHGDVIGVIGVSRDITRRRLADALREGQSEILQLIAGGAPMQHVLEELVHLAESPSSGTSALVILLNEDGELGPWATSLRSLDTRCAELLHGPLGEPIRRNEIVVVADVETDGAWIDHWAYFTAFDLHSAWMAPILSRSGAPVGVLAIFARQLREPTEAEFKVLHVAAQLAAIAGGNAGEREAV
jgi:PAS domain S-box-containing protein